MIKKHEKTFNIWDKVFENGPSKICGREPLNNLFEGIWSA